MLKIEKVPFTEKFPFLYVIRIQDRCRERRLTTTNKDNADKVLKALNDKMCHDWQDVPISLKIALAKAGMID